MYGFYETHRTVIWTGVGLVLLAAYFVYFAFAMNYRCVYTYNRQRASFHRYMRYSYMQFFKYIYMIILEANKRHRADTKRSKFMQVFAVLLYCSNMFLCLLTLPDPFFPQIWWRGFLEIARFYIVCCCFDDCGETVQCIRERNQWLVGE